MNKNGSPTEEKKHYHFIGVGGIGMSGLARILCQQGESVSGSDLSANDVTRGLESLGAKIHVGHDAAYVSANDIVVYSTQVKRDNPEFRAASDLQCPLWHRSDLLHHLTRGKVPLAIAGTHGKTTTTSLMTSVLVEAGWDPCYAIGGVVPQLQSNASWGNGVYFVLEADESDGTFLTYQPEGAIVTNIDGDHLDHYRNESNLIEAFRKFLSGVGNKQWLFWCADDCQLVQLCQEGVSYGFHADAQLRISNLRQTGWSLCFDIDWQRKSYRDIEVALTGRHNALNASAVFGFALSLGIPEEAIRAAFRQFKGVKRRCELKGIHDDVMVIDDYGHHPTEVAVTLQALRKAEPNRRLVAVFQPHRYSRTQQCATEFGTAFDAADHLFVTDLYAAMEEPIPGVDCHLVIREVQKKSPVPCEYIPRASLGEDLAQFLKPNDLVVTLGAGDITKGGVEILNALKSLEASHV
jgi:UDP-N-acetylmuramate--alanine ligase